MKSDNIRQYMRDETEIQKKYRSWSDMFLFGLTAFFSLIFCCMFGLSGGEGEDRVLEPYMIFIFMMLSFCTIFMICHNTYAVSEKNQQVNIFNKYMFVPRKPGEMFAAKLLLMVKRIAVLSAIGQAAALLVNLAVNKGSFVIFPETFAPVYMGIAGFINVFLELLIRYKRAYNK